MLNEYIKARLSYSLEDFPEMAEKLRHSFTTKNNERFSDDEIKQSKFEDFYPDKISGGNKDEINSAFAKFSAFADMVREREAARQQSEMEKSQQRQSAIMDVAKENEAALSRTEPAQLDDISKKERLLYVQETPDSPVKRGPGLKMVKKTQIDEMLASRADKDKAREGMYKNVTDAYEEALKNEKDPKKRTEIWKRYSAWSDALGFKSGVAESDEIPQAVLETLITGGLMAAPRIAGKIAGKASLKGISKATDAALMRGAEDLVPKSATTVSPLAGKQLVYNAIAEDLVNQGTSKLPFRTLTKKTAADGTVTERFVGAPLKKEAYVVQKGDVFAPADYEMGFMKPRQTAPEVRVRKVSRSGNTLELDNGINVNFQGKDVAKELAFKESRKPLILQGEAGFEKMREQQFGLLSKAEQKKVYAALKKEYPDLPESFLKWQAENRRVSPQEFIAKRDDRVLRALSSPETGQLDPYIAKAVGFRSSKIVPTGKGVQAVADDVLETIGLAQDPKRVLDVGKMVETGLRTEQKMGPKMVEVLSSRENALATKAFNDSDFFRRVNINSDGLERAANKGEEISYFMHRNPEVVRDVWLARLSTDKNARAALNKMGYTDARLDDLAETVLRGDPSDIRVRLNRKLQQIYDTVLDKYNASRELSGIAPIKDQKTYATKLIDFAAAREAGGMSESAVETAMAKVAGYDDMANLFGHNTKKGLHAGSKTPGEAKMRVGSELPIRLDFANVFDDYLKHFTEAYTKNPYMSSLREVVGHSAGKGMFTETLSSAPSAFEFLDGHINRALGMQTGPAMVNDPRFNRFLARLQSNLTFSALSGSIGTVLRQPGALQFAAAEVGYINQMKGIAMRFTEEGKNLLELSNILKIRGTDKTLDDVLGYLHTLNQSGRKGVISSYYNMMRETPLQAIKVVDEIFAEFAYLGAYNKAMKMGMKPLSREAINYADEVVVMTQGSSASHHISPIQATALGRFVTMFQTFAINEANYYARLLSLKPSQAMGIALRLSIAQSAWDLLTEDLPKEAGLPYLRSNNPRPFMRAYEASKAGGNPVTAALMSMAQTVPVIGGAFGSGEGMSPLGAGAQYLTKLSQAAGGEAGRVNVGALAKLVASGGLGLPKAVIDAIGYVSDQGKIKSALGLTNPRYDKKRREWR